MTQEVRESGCELDQVAPAGRHGEVGVRGATARARLDRARDGEALASSGLSVP